MEKLAHVISWVFMPLLMPIYALILVLYVPSDQDFFFNEECLYVLKPGVKLALLYVFGIFGVVAPGLSFVFLKRYGIIDSIEMDTKKERSIPIIIMLIYCLVLYIFIIRAANPGLPKFVYGLPLSGIAVTAVFYLLNRWRKVSIHSGATGIATGFVLAYILFQTEYHLWVFGVTILITGLVMSARIYLGKHNLQESIIGWLAGCLITFGINYFI